jgi:hypothetical protein
MLLSYAILTHLVKAWFVRHWGMQVSGVHRLSRRLRAPAGRAWRRPVF